MSQPAAAATARPELSAAKRALLDRLAAGGARAADPLPRHPGDGPVPLSYPQERVWFLDRLAGELPLFHLAMAVRVPFALDRDDLERQLAVVVARQDSLRTAVEVRDEEPCQRVLPAVPVGVEVHDRSATPAADVERVARETALAVAARPYELDRPPLWRVALVRLPGGEDMVVVAAHHIVSDAGGLVLFYRELFPAGPLPELPVRHLDVAAWQRSGAGSAERELEYWRGQLADLPPALELPADRPRPAVGTLAGGTLTGEVPLEVSRRVHELARREGATPYLVTLAAFDVLLHRVTGARDLLVGASVSGRTRPESQHLIGMFVNMVVLRASLAGRPTFRELLAQQRATASAAFARQSLPYERLVRELRRAGDAARGGLVQVAFNMPAPMTAPPGVTLVDLPIAVEGSQFDLTAHVVRSGDESLRVLFEYAADLFDPPTVRRLLDAYVLLLDGLTAAPDRPVDAAPLVAPAERARLVGGTGPAGPTPPAGGDRPLHLLVAEQARATPDAPAVLAGDTVLSYAELDTRANGVAARLRQLGVGPDVPVGVHLRRSPDLAVALLGVWKAGGAYLPLDPDQPPARRRALLADTAPPVVLTGAALAGELAGLAGDPAIVVVADVPAAAAAPAVDVRPGHAAYVVHTSGSTGQPKGAVVPHAGIANRVLWTVRRHRLGPADRVLQKTRITFDAAGWEFFAPLVSGGTVVLAPPGAEDDPALMLDAVAAGGVTVLQVVPSVLRLLADAPGWAGCRSLRLLFSAGEPLRAELCARVAALVPGLRIVNTYGPTECAIDVTAQEWEPAQAAGPVPIGRPLDGLRVLVLDRSGEPVPVGVPGDLYVGGVGVGRGYHGRPALTAAAFVPDPYGPPGGRLYRTGDVARWRADDRLEFLGRRDDQVKVNGVRVEPGEVTAALLAHPAVRDAAVLPRPAADGTRLVAYVVADAPAEELRRHLRGRLPAPLVPGTVVPLPALPLTSSGKLDRAALPAPAEVAGPEHVAPRDDVERAVAAVWEELLEVGGVGATDDFFARGGHSLLLSRLAARLTERLGVPVSMRDLFAAVTVEEQAQVVRSRGADGDGPRAGDEPADAPAPLSSGQRRQWFLDRLDPHSSLYVVPTVTRLTGPLDLPALTAALAEVVRRNEVLRTRYPEVDGEPVAVVDPPAAVPVRVVEAPGADRRRVAELVGAELDRPFDLATGPVLRASVLRTAPTEHVLVLAVHHIAADGWSTGVLGRQLAAEYAAYPSGGGLSGRPEPVLRYRDYTRWQLGRLAGGALDDQLAGWREQLAGAVPVELATDRPRPPEWDPAGAVLPFAVPADLAYQVLRLGREERATPFMTLLAAFDVLLARCTGLLDLSVGTPVSGRTRPELEDLVGLVANTLVLRTRLADGHGFRPVLHRVRATCLAAYAGQEVPFERLVDELQPERDLSRNPLFQVMFETAGTGAAVPLPGLVAEPVLDLSWRTAKFDLTLGLAEQPDGSLLGYVEYATALFDAATVQRLAEQYVRVLRAVVAEPDRPLSRLDLGPGADPGEADDRPVPGGPDECLHEAVARQAARRPEAVAVEQDGVRLTYAELDEAAEVLATRLRAAGAGPETPVAVLARRSPEAVVALLGVLKSGSAYVPLDPDNPDERLAVLVADVGARVVLAQPGLAGRLAGLAVPVLPLDGSPAPAAAAAAGTRPRPGNLAYVIYTSGSTGRPKGVMIEHRAYLHHCRVIAREYDIRPDDRVVLLSALVFDVAMDQIAATLLVGATVVVAAAGLWNPAELPDRLAAEGVTVMEITPAYYRETMAGVGPGDPRLRGLRLMNVGSDVVTYGDAQRWLDSGLPGRFLCNYGPTEATVTCTLHPVPPGEAAGRDPAAAVPIGRPVPGAAAHVLDRWLNPVPPGVPGELYLGGVRLARGYLGRPDRTAERFVPDPTGPAGARLYRTGDLVRRRADGALEFLGRLDGQVKIRGFRIELGEVEATLAGCPGVRAAAVTAYRSGGDPELVAYVVAEPGAAPAPAALRDRLKATLPAYMVPAHWVFLPELPLTPSAKVDRRALPPPDRGARVGPAHVAPATPVQRRLAEIWAEVLGVEGIGVDDDFFLLGGHSLLATRVHSRLQEAFAVRLALRRLFEASTLGELAAEITAAVEAEVDAQVGALSDDEVLALLGEEAG